MPPGIVIHDIAIWHIHPRCSLRKLFWLDLSGGLSLSVARQEECYELAPQYYEARIYPYFVNEYFRNKEVGSDALLL